MAARSALSPYVLGIMYPILGSFKRVLTDTNGYLQTILIETQAYATTAQNYATQAQASAVASSASASSATLSASSASASSARVTALLYSFQKIYYGELASDPSKDPNGNAPVEGAGYFNTTEQKLRIYNGTAWVDYDSDAEQLTQNAALSASSAAASVTAAQNAATTANTYATNSATSASNAQASATASGTAMRSSQTYATNAASSLSQCQAIEQALEAMIKALPGPSDNTPVMDWGTGGPGKSASFSRSDHYHPSDNARLSTTGGTIYGNLAVTKYVTCDTITASENVVGHWVQSISNDTDILGNPMSPEMGTCRTDFLGDVSKNVNGTYGVWFWYSRNPSVSDTGKREYLSLYMRCQDGYMRTFAFYRDGTTSTTGAMP